MSSHAIRIAIVRQRYTPFGGAARIMDSAIRQFASEGRDVRFTVVSRRWPTDGGSGAEFLRCDPPYLGRTMRDSAFERAACRATRSGFDLVQSHERTPCADIYRVGDGLHEDWLDALGHDRPGWLRALIRLDPYHAAMIRRERRMFASGRIRAFIANSGWVAERIAARYPGAVERTVIIRNGVDAERFRPELRHEHRPTVLGRFGLAKDTRIVVFVGSNWRAKGLATAIRAIADLARDIHLVVVGKERRAAAYRRLADRGGVSDRVHFVGKVDDPLPYFAAADSFVLPSLFDAMPNAALEAMACGLPVVVSANSGARDLVQEGVEGFVRDPFTPAGWSEAIARTLEPGARERMGGAARAVAERNTLRHMTDGWFDLYRSLLAGRFGTTVG